MRKFWYIGLCIVFWGLLSCDKPKKYSPVPNISFNQLTVEKGLDVLGNPAFMFVLNFDFVDGDGDLGLDASDTLGQFAPNSEYYYNLQIVFYEKKNGVLVQHPNIQFPYRFQNISKSNTTNPVVKGEMSIEFDLSQTQQYADTCCFGFFIFDRALNQSNTERTHEVYLYR